MIKVIQALKIVLTVVVIGSFASCDKESNQSYLQNRKEIANEKALDQQLVVDLWENEMYFVQVATLSEERAQDPKLKELALGLKRKHQDNLNHIVILAQEKGYTIPDKLPANQQEKLYKLTMVNQADFKNYFYQSIKNDYKLELDSLATLVNNQWNTTSHALLLDVSKDYEKSLDQIKEFSLL